MAWQFPQSATSTSTVAYLDEVGESVFVAPQVSIVTDGGGFYTVHALATEHQIVVAGTVAGILPIFVGTDNNDQSDTKSVVTVEQTGQVRSFSSTAIRIEGLGEVVNHGLVKTIGGGQGITFDESITGISRLTNTGIIESQQWAAVSHGIFALGTLITTNTGTMQGRTAYESIGNALDLLTNSGKMIGDVDLGGGDDLFDGRLGTVQGNVFGGTGNDRLYAGIGDNKLYGQDGNDTLMGGAGGDYLSGGTGIDRATYSSATKAVTVSLTNPSINKGDAAGDTFNSVENLTGSNFSDFLHGNNAKNAINGGAGGDTITGHGGNDTLTGGSGKDFFAFVSALSATTNVDTITDFSFADDTIQLDDAIFTAFAGRSGTILPGHFRANTTGLAQDASDFIIYEIDTGELYYDTDGTGSGGGILFAELGIGLGLTYADFMVI